MKRIPDVRSAHSRRCCNSQVLRWGLPEWPFAALAWARNWWAQPQAQSTSCESAHPLHVWLHLRAFIMVSLPDGKVEKVSTQFKAIHGRQPGVSVPAARSLAEGDLEIWQPQHDPRHGADQGDQ